MKTLRRIGILLLASVFTISTIAVPRPAYAVSSRDILNEGTKAAKHIGNITFTNYLMASLYRTSPWFEILNQTAMAEKAWRDESSAILKSVSQMAMEYTTAKEMIESQDVDIAELDKALERYNDAYVSATVTTNRLVAKFNSAKNLAPFARNAVNDVLADVEQVCAKGISAQFSGENLTPVTPQWTGWDVGFEFGVQTNTDGAVKKPVYGFQTMPIFGQIFKENPAEANAVGTHLFNGLGGIAAYQLLVGTKLMTAGLVAGLAAGGITIAVAFVLLLVSQGIERNESRQAADEVQRAFEEKPDERTVSKFVREACHKTIPPLRDVPRLIDAALKGEAGQKEIAARTEKANAQLNELAKLGDLMAKRRSEFTGRDADIDAKVANTGEAKKFRELYEKFGAEATAESLAMALVQTGLAANMFESSVTQYAKGIQIQGVNVQTFLKSRRQQMILRRNQLYAWIRQENLRLQNPKLAEA